MASLDSLNGPSVTVVLPPRWRTVVAVFVALSSSPPVILPLFVYCSNHSPTRLYAAWISGLLGSQFESSLMNMSMYFTAFLRGAPGGASSAIRRPAAPIFDTTRRKPRSRAFRPGTPALLRH